MASAETALRNQRILERILFYLIDNDDGIEVAERESLRPIDLIVTRPSDHLRDVLNFAVVVNQHLKSDRWEFLNFAVINKYLPQNAGKENSKELVEAHNKCISSFNRAYNDTFPPILKLPIELLQKILDYLTGNSGNLVPITDRASLSVDSFSSVAPPLPEDSTQILSFTLVCQKFRVAGLRHILVRVRTRFSLQGFARLRKIAETAALRDSVRQFSYMIPRFYPPDGTTLEDELGRARGNVRDTERTLAQRAQSTLIHQ